MKLIVLFLCLNFSALVVFAQTNEDKQEVLQKSIDLNDLQQYYHPEQEGRKPLIIYQNGVVPFVKLEKFGGPVQYSNQEEIFYWNYKAFLEFQKFEITPNRAEVLFLYKIEGVKISIVFEKIDDMWIIKNQKISEL